MLDHGVAEIDYFVGQQSSHEDLKEHQIGYYAPI